MFLIFRMVQEVIFFDYSKFLLASLMLNFNGNAFFIKKKRDAFDANLFPINKIVQVFKK